VNKTVRVWDLPIRLFHWTLALSIALGIVFVKIGGNAIQWHAYCGYVTLTLVIFRIIWGFVGSWHARFFNFVPSPKRFMAYLRGQTEGGLGHSPLGAFSVLALLLAVLIQALTGLFADDDIFFQGPLAKYVSNSKVAFLTSVHHFNQYIIFALVGLHVLAIFYYLLVKKDNLIQPMITGDKNVPANISSQAVDTMRQRLAALMILLGVGIGLYYLIR
jgi:cytochrome b